ncbi:L-lysine 2,3-aminomutase [Lentimicrobium saccharophilum]|uniref:L-lysine 2,3-aminomutase n=1 Tax=Lentimicrobium saccharophilum TaxID=1678841 RepID=A0A0S7C5R6_9BACT|nr:lysine 2,3-aminomutase [Lentimicrobium saccharophilum]GAP44489.1 L-lysine 2,3-aminomutase [Lentimicrobium saccharophilum]
MSELYEYKAYTARNFRSLPQIRQLPESLKKEMEIVAMVLPFKSNSYVVNELIDWENVPDDPIFRLTFPDRGMLSDHHFDRLKTARESNTGKNQLEAVIHEIRMELNPHPAGQLALNIPVINGKKLEGIQHKYRETVLFFPSQGQTCHAYCTFCFRWPQFTGMEGMKIASAESRQLADYLRNHREVTNVLFTGGDPLVMKSSILNKYISPLLGSGFEHIHTIRIGSKALAYWPYRFTAGQEADDLLRLFEKVAKAGKQLAFMAHFNHPVELGTKAVKNAIKLIRSSGAEIRTQSPILRHINDSAKIWARMWRTQSRLGCIPYYMFMARDTGAKSYFNVTIEKAYEIYREAYSKVSGMSKTVRGPVMSASPGKVHILGISEIAGEKIFILQFIQGRNPDWVRRPFFAGFNAEASWLTDLYPAFGEEKFFWQDDFEKLARIKMHQAVKQEDD